MLKALERENLKYLCHQTLSSTPRLELEQQLYSMGWAKVHAKSLFKAHFRYASLSKAESQRLPKELQPLVTVSSKSELIIQQTLESQYDRSIKFLIQLQDQSLIEAVLMPETSRLTLCISTQVGCRQACSFCQTGRMGLHRNLHTHEIVDQVRLAGTWARSHPAWLQRAGLPANQTVTNIVFMGMGEPLDNLDALIPSIHILTDPYGTNIPLKKISVSTAGHLDGLKALFRVFPTIPVAFSLHSVDDRTRNKIMPINRSYPFSEVLAFLKHHYQGQKKLGIIFIQFTLIRGINDDLDTAASLAQILKDIPVKVNIIPMNSVDGSRFEGPDYERLFAFRDLLHQSGIRVMIRYSKGQDIGGACGQLATHN